MSYSAMKGGEEMARPLALNGGSKPLFPTRRHWGWGRHHHDEVGRTYHARATPMAERVLRAALGDTTPPPRCPACDAAEREATTCPGCGQSYDRAALRGPEVPF
jgi:hypothetical protein